MRDIGEHMEHPMAKQETWVIKAGSSLVSGKRSRYK